MVQRDGCWVRQVEKWGRITEALGPCTKPVTDWSSDRPTRLVQECISDAGWRWQNAALSAWARGETWPAPVDDRQLLDACHAEAARTVAQQNEALRERIEDVTLDRERTLTHNEQLANVLGEAAKKPAGSATASAHADGRSSSTNDSQSTHAAELAAPATLNAPQPIALPPTPASTQTVKAVVKKSPAPLVIEEPDSARLLCEPQEERASCSCD